WDCPCLRWDIDLTAVRARDAAVDLLTLGLSALKRGERAGAERALADLATLNGNRAPPAPGHERDEVPDIVQLELQALLRQAGGAGDLASRRPGPSRARGSVSLCRGAVANCYGSTISTVPPAEMGPLSV